MDQNLIDELTKMQVTNYDSTSVLSELGLDFVDYAYLQFLVQPHQVTAGTTIEELSSLFSIVASSNA